MNPKFKPIAKLFICILIFATVYPIITLINGFLEMEGTIFQTVGVILFGTTVFFLRDSLINRSAKPFVTFFAPIFLIAAGVIITIICMIDAPLLGLIALCIIMLATGLFAFFSAGREPVELLSIGAIGWITGLDLVTFFVIAGSDYPYCEAITLIDYFLICAFRFILANQDTLEDLTVSRHYTFAALPQKIRSYNFFMISGILAIIATAFLLLRNLKAILTWLFETLSAFFKYIVKLLLQLFGSGENSQAPIEEISTDSMEMPVLPPSDNSYSWLWDIIYYIFLFLILCGLAALTVYLIYRLSKWKIPRKTKEITSEYTDSEQILTPVTKKQKRRQDSRHRWNRDYSAYKKMNEGEEKFHFGYSLAVRGFLLHGLPLLQSDTTCEIDIKVSKSLQEKAYHEATVNFNTIVYGETPYTKESAKAISEALSEIAGLKMGGASGNLSPSPYKINK